MKITIEIPPNVEQAIVSAFGGNFDRAAKEALAIEWYRAEKLSIGQVAELLGTSVYEAEGFLKSHQVASHYSAEDLAQDRATLKRLLPS
ncbi:MAG: UPF0175 family protein [Pirellulales bacterium]